MKLVELFCGTGGFSRGAHSAGFEVAVAYDNDAILTSSYSRNFPKTKLLLRDVSTLTGDEIRTDVGGSVFGLFGGPPCQGFSDIGRRDANDPRRALLHHFFRLVAELAPTFFIMENVRGLAYADVRPLLDSALAMVAGYYEVLGPQTLDAADFGAATRRNRMFVIGIRKDCGAAVPIETIQARKRPPATVRHALADLQNLRELCEANELPGFDRWIVERRGAPTRYAAALRAPDRITTGHRSTAHTPQVTERFKDLQPGKIDRIGRHHRLELNGQCPTLRAGTGSDKGSYQSVRPIHPELHRVITVREAARLQGFPDEHLFHPTIWHSFRMIGNSVSPIMAKAVFSAVRDHLGLSIGEEDQSFEWAEMPAQHSCQALGHESKPSFTLRNSAG